MKKLAVYLFLALSFCLFGFWLYLENASSSVCSENGKKELLEAIQNSPEISQEVYEAIIEHDKGIEDRKALFGWIQEKLGKRRYVPVLNIYYAPLIRNHSNRLAPLIMAMYVEDHVTPKQCLNYIHNQAREDHWHGETVQEIAFQLYEKPFEQLPKVEKQRLVNRYLKHSTKLIAELRQKKSEQSQGITDNIERIVKTIQINEALSDFTLTTTLKGSTDKYYTKSKSAHLAKVVRIIPWKDQKARNTLYYFDHKEELIKVEELVGSDTLGWFYFKQGEIIQMKTIGHGEWEDPDLDLDSAYTEQAQKIKTIWKQDQKS